MQWWIVPVLGFGVSALFYAVRLPVRRFRSQRLGDRAAQGRAVSVPALGGPTGDERRGRVRDDGEALVFWSGRRQPLRLPRGAPYRRP